MKYLFIKLLRDFKSLWPQFISVLCMAMLSLAIISGIGCVRTGIEQTTDKYYEDTNLCDAIIYIKGATSKDINKFKELTYIESASGSMAFMSNLITNEETTPDIQIVTLNDQTQGTINPLIRDGCEIKNSKGIWIDEDFAKKRNIKVGDTIDITLQDNIISMKVKGLVLHSEYVYYVTSANDTLPDPNLHGYGFISEDYAKSFMPMFYYNQIRLDMADNTKATTVKNDADSILQDRLISITDRKDNIYCKQVKDELSQMKSMAILFSSVFILLALLTMYTTMSRLANKQIVEIGTMKELGFKNKDIYFHYAIYGFVVSLIGSILGIILGILFVSRFIIKVKKTTLILPEWTKPIPWEAIVVAGLMIFICIIASVLTVRKIVKNVPAETLRGNIKSKSKNIKPISFKKHFLSYEWRWVLRDIKLNKIRYSIGVIAVLGNLVLMVAGVCIIDSIVKSNDDVFQNQFTYSYIGDIKSKDYETIKSDFDSYNVQFSSVYSADIFSENSLKNAVITVIGEGDYYNLYDLNEKPITLSDNGAVISKMIAEKLGIKKGDIINYKTDTNSNKKSIEIVAITSAKMPQGLFLTQKTEDNFIPNTIYIGDEESLKKAKTCSYISNIKTIEAQRENVDKIIDSVRGIAYILIIASLVLSFVILYNLGVLNYTERYRQYATMKVLGFYQKEISVLALRDSILTIIPGYILGVPLSLVFLKLYAKIVAFDSAEWVGYITPVHFALCSLFVIGCAIGVSLIISNKVKKVIMVEALKSVD